MFKQIAYPFSTALTVTPTPDAPLWQPAFVPSVPASRGFPWLWVVLLLILGAIVLWWIAQSATRAAQTGLTQPRLDLMILSAGDAPTGTEETPPVVTAID
jgi:hypothetical protein